MKIYNQFVSESRLRKLSVLIIMFALLYLMKNMISLLLFTFIFTYISFTIMNTINNRFNLSSKKVIIFLYSILVSTLLFLLVKNIPIIINQSSHLYTYIFNFYQDVKSKKTIFGNEISDVLKHALPYIKLQTGHLFSSAQGMISLLATVIFSSILSFFFLVEVEKVNSFFKLFLHGKFSWFFNDIYFFGTIFVKSFGVTIKAQIAIAITNSILTSLVLMVLKFPHILSLFLMIFLLSFIPVAGVIISFFPLAIIAYTNGGIKDIAIILVTILFVHLLESYVLNPKFMSRSTELPIFCTFLILLFSEHFLGLWGLIFGIPLTLFFLDILDIKKLD